MYYNRARFAANCNDGTLNYCCTTPLPSTGISNLTADPGLASASHLSAGSPCRGKGSAAYTSGTDIDGERWGSPPSIGCDEYWSGSVTGALSAAIVVSYTNVAVEFAVDFQAVIGGRVSASSWNFGDGVVVSNRPYASHGWGTAGDYVVELRAYNESYPTGVAATVTVRVEARPVHYVALASASPVSPYTNRVTAATNIQDAVDAATLPGALVRVSDGMYTNAARAVYGMSNRVAVTKPVTVQSVNGPGVTTIAGYGPNGDAAVRCVYLTNGAVLAGFTLTSGGTQTSGEWYKQRSGGGVWCESSGVVSNCVLRGNYASEDGGGAYSGTLNNCVLTSNSAFFWGGGAFAGTLNNCTLTGNSASSYGGGAHYSTLNNCTLTSNSATGQNGAGGGASDSTLNNCIVYYNSAPSGGNYGASTLNYCCTTPPPGTGLSNFTSAPLFVDQAGGNLRLQTNSPCINAGNNAYPFGATDLDGNPRISGGIVDVGAYEFQFPDPFRTWLAYYGLPTNGSADYVDTDHDGHNNWQEWVAGTNPTNAASVLRLQPPQVTLPKMLLRWTSDTNHAYFVERAASLKAPLTFTLVQANIPGLPNVTAYTDRTAPASPTAFYRVGTGASNSATPPRLELAECVPGTMTLTWTSVTNRSYFVERATNLVAPLAFSLLRTNIHGLPDTTSFTDASPPTSGPAFYRIGVQQ